MTKKAKLDRTISDDNMTISTKDRNENESEEERTLRKQLRRAKKMARHLEKLGLDENGEELDNFSLSKYPVRESTFTISGMNDRVAVNPVVTLMAIIVLWSIVVWCTVSPDNALVTLGEWKTFIARAFTWLYQGSRAIFLFFIMFIVYKYGHVHLGEKDEKPEFSLFATLSMVITAGATNGLLVYSVLEPMSHQTSNFFAQSNFRSQDEISMNAINLTVTNWGLGGWAPYTIVAIAMSLAAYRFNLPMTYRSCFYPILGQYTWGWIGDMIDGTAIIVTLLGIFTNLGLAAMNIVAGFTYMGWIDEGSTDEHLASIQNSVVWLIIMISLASAISGLHGGIQYLCVFAMSLSAVLAFLVFSMDDTKFLANVQVQELGVYLQTSILQLNFWTDAFGQLHEGSGRAIDGQAAEVWWMETWMIFTQAWWVTIAAVNGQFIASISRGRKIWEVVMFSLVAPFAYCLVWFSIWGGIGLRQSRQALELQELGATFFNNSGHFLVDGSEYCYDVPQDQIVVEGTAIFTNRLLGVTPVCIFDEITYDTAIFRVLNSFSFPESFGNGGLGYFLSVLFMFTCACFFMASAGSASLVVDKMASNGRKNSHLARRMFWLVTVGALATALLSSGGSGAVAVVQAAVIVCGLPCVILLCYLMQSICLLCQGIENITDSSDYTFPDQAEFSIPIYGGIFNIMEYLLSCGKVNASRVELQMDRVTRLQFVEFLKGVFVPFVSLHQILTSTYKENIKTNKIVVTFYALSYLTWVVISLASVSLSGLRGVSLALFVVNGGFLAFIRSAFRACYTLRSNAIGDIVTSTILWPQVLTQLRLQCNKTNHSGDNEKESNVKINK